MDILGIIAPHPPIMVHSVGGHDSQVTSASAEAMHQAASVLEKFAPQTVVIMSPHSPAAQDAFLVDTAAHTSGTFEQFGAGGTRLSYSTDVEFARALLSALDAEEIDSIDRGTARSLEPGILDHGVLVPMSFLDPTGRWPIVNLSLSWLPYQLHRRLGEIVAEVAEQLGRRIAFVASGDCSHRLKQGAPAGFSPRAAEFDRALVQLVEAGDFEGLMHMDPQLVEAAGECGLRSFVTLGGVIPDAAAKVLAYEGPWGVGYMTAIAAPPALLDSLFTPESGHKSGMAGDAESEPVALARRTVEVYVRERRVIEPGTPEGLLGTQAGAFVSLHREHNLRGCIGTIAPTAATLAEEIIHNAIQAATEDPRFPELTTHELQDLEISVDVLHTPEPCGLEDLDPARYGVIVTADWRRGLLLPDLEGVDTPEQQIDIAMRKAGIASGERVHLERFLVDRYH
ncbi:MAG: AmmeMemoRadiSam system protein A [Actinobacteria bacterium HGW-Actinobacteria-6]|jgi:AmmeMemoRadiSam system protein A|nr:MAG: AmmeMemoRadiSam system protein A [Actinobacteria bacterium HGW-Actinobacteria-6]